MAFKGTASGATSVTITKGDGTLQYSASAAALDSTDVTKALSAGSWSGEFNDKVTSIDATKASGAITINTAGSKLTSVITGKKDDNVTGANSALKTITTNAGADKVTIDGADKSVVVDTGAGNDVVNVNSQAGNINMGAGNDTLNLTAKATSVDMGAGNDVVNVTAGSGSVITLGKGKDTINLSDGTTANIADYTTKDDTIKFTNVKNALSVTNKSGTVVITGGTNETYPDNAVKETNEVTYAGTSPTGQKQVTGKITKHTITKQFEHAGANSGDPNTWDTTSTSAIGTRWTDVTTEETATFTFKFDTAGNISIESTGYATQEKAETEANENAVWYTGFSSSADSISFTSADGVSATDAANLKYTFAKKADSTDTMVETVTYDFTNTRTGVTASLQGAADSLINIRNSDGTLIYEQTPGAITGSGSKKAYDVTNANTGTILRFEEADGVQTITNTKRTKALNITAYANSIVAGSGADTINTQLTGGGVAFVDGGKGADRFVINAGQNYVIDGFTLGTNTKKVDALVLGNGVDSVVNLTAASDVKLGNAVLQFGTVNTEVDATTNATTTTLSTAAVVTVIGGAWDGAAKGKELLILNTAGAVSSSVGYPDKAVAIQSVAGGNTEVSDNRPEDDKVETWSYFTANKALNVTGGEYNAVGGKKGDTLTARDTEYKQIKYNVAATDITVAVTNVPTGVSTLGTNSYQDSVAKVTVSKTASVTKPIGFNNNQVFTLAFDTTGKVNRVYSGEVAAAQLGTMSEEANLLDGTEFSFTFADNNGQLDGADVSDSTLVDDSTYGQQVYNGSFTIDLSSAANVGVSESFSTSWLGTASGGARSDYKFYTHETPALVSMDGGVGNDLLISNPRGGTLLGGAGNDTLKIGLAAATLSNNLSNSHDAAAAGNAGNDVFLIDGFTSGEITDYTNATATAFADAAALKNVKKQNGTDKIVFAYDTYKTKNPQSQVTITGVNSTDVDKKGVKTLADGSTVAASTFDIELTVENNAYNPTIGTANTSTGQQVVTAGAFESDRADDGTAGYLSESENEIVLKDLAVGENLAVTYQGTTYTQAASVDKTVTATGNYLGLLNDKVEQITGTKASKLVGGFNTTKITGSGKNDTLVANNNTAATTLTGGEGKDVFDVTAATGFIADYDSKNDKVKVANLGDATKDMAQLGTTSANSGNKGTETFSFTLATAAGGVEVTAAIDRQNGNAINFTIDGGQAHFANNTTTYSNSGANFTLNLGTRQYVLALTGTMGTNNTFGTDYAFSTADSHIYFGTAADALTAATSSAANEDGTSRLTYAFGTFDVAYKSNSNEIESAKNVITGEDLDTKDGFAYDSTKAYKLATDGFHEVTYGNTDAIAISTSDNASLVASLNNTFYADRFTFGTADITTQATAGAAAKTTSHLSDKQVNYLGAEVKNGATNAITFIKETELPVYNSKTNKYTGTKKTTTTEIRTFDANAKGTASILSAGASDVVNVYNDDADQYIRVVNAGSKAASINNASFAVATINGSAKADTIRSVGRIVDGALTRTTVKSGNGNDVIAGDAYVEVTDFTAAKLKANKYASGDIVDFYTPAIFNDEDDVKNGIKASDITNLFVKESAQANDEGTGQDFHRLGVTFEGQDVIIGGVKLDNMKNKVAAFQVWDDDYKASTIVTATLSNVKEYIETDAKAKSIDLAGQDYVAIDSTKATKGVNIQMGTNIKAVTAGKGVDTINVGSSQTQTIAGGAGADFIVFGTNAAGSTVNITDYAGDKLVFGEGVSLTNVTYSQGQASVMAGKGKKAHAVTYSDVTLTLSNSTGGLGNTTVVLKNVSSDQGYKITRAPEAGSKLFGAYNYNVDQVSKNNTGHIATIAAADGTYFDIGGGNADTVLAQNSKAVTITGADKEDGLTIKADGKGAITYIGATYTAAIGSDNTQRTLEGSYSKSATDTEGTMKVDLSSGRYRDKTTGETTFNVTSDDNFSFTIDDNGKITKITDVEFQKAYSAATSGSEPTFGFGSNGVNAILTKVGDTDVPADSFTNGVYDLSSSPVAADGTKLTFTIGTDAATQQVKEYTINLNTTDKTVTLTYSDPISAKDEVVKGEAAKFIGSAKADVYVGNGNEDDVVDFRLGGNNTLRGTLSGTASLGANTTASNEVVLLDNNSNLTLYNYNNTAKKTGGLDKIYLDTVFGAGELTGVYKTNSDGKNYGIQLDFAGTYNDETEITPEATIDLADYSKNGNQAVYIGQAKANAKGKLTYSAINQMAYGFTGTADNEVLTVTGSAAADTIEVNKTLGEYAIQIANGGKGNDVFKVYTGDGSAEGTPTLQAFNVGKDVVQIVGKDEEGKTWVNKTFDLSDYSDKYTYLGGDTATLHYYEKDEDDVITVSQDVVLTGVGTKTSLATSGIRTSTDKKAKAIALSNQQNVVLKASPSVSTFKLGDWGSVTKSFDASKVSAKTTLTVKSGDSLTAYTAGKGKDILTIEETAKAPLTYTYTAQAATTSDQINLALGNASINNKNALTLAAANGLTIGNATNSADDLNTVTVAVNKGTKSAGNIVLRDTSKEGGLFTYTYDITQTAAKAKGGSGDDSDTMLSTFTYTRYVNGPGFTKATAVETKTVTDAEVGTNKSVNDATVKKVIADEFGYAADGTTELKVGKNQEYGKSYGDDVYKTYVVTLAEGKHGSTPTEDQLGGSKINDQVAIVTTVKANGKTTIDSFKIVNGLNTAGDAISTLGSNTFTPDKTADATSTATYTYKANVDTTITTSMTFTSTTVEKTMNIETTTTSPATAGEGTNIQDKSSDETTAETDRPVTAAAGKNNNGAGTAVSLDINLTAANTNGNKSATITVPTDDGAGTSTSSTVTLGNISVALTFTATSNGAETPTYTYALSKIGDVDVSTLSDANEITLTADTGDTVKANYNATSKTISYTATTYTATADYTSGTGLTDNKFGGKNDWGTTVTNDAWGNFKSLTFGTAVLTTSTTTAQLTNGTATQDLTVTYTSDSKFTLNYNMNDYTAEFDLPDTDSKKYTVTYTADAWGNSDRTKIAGITYNNAALSGATVTNGVATFKVDPAATPGTADVAKSTNITVTSDAQGAVKATWQASTHADTFELDGKTYTVHYGTDAFGNTNTAALADSNVITTTEDNVNFSSLTRSDTTTATFTNKASNGTTDAPTTFTLNLSPASGNKNVTWTTTTFTGKAKLNSTDDVTFEYGTDAFGNSTSNVTKVAGTAIGANGSFTYSNNTYTDAGYHIDSNGKVAYTQNIEGYVLNNLGVAYDSNHIDEPASTKNYIVTAPVDVFGNRQNATTTNAIAFENKGLSDLADGVVDTSKSSDLDAGKFTYNNGNTNTGLTDNKIEYTVTLSGSGTSRTGEVSGEIKSMYQNISTSVSLGDALTTYTATESEDESYMRKLEATTNAEALTKYSAAVADSDSDIGSAFTNEDERTALTNKIADVVDRYKVVAGIKSASTGEVDFEERFNDIETTALFSDFVSSDSNNLSDLVDSKVAVDVASTATETDHKNFLSHILASSNLHTNKK